MVGETWPDRFADGATTNANFVAIGVSGTNVFLGPADGGHPFRGVGHVERDGDGRVRVARCEGIGLVRLSLQTLDERSRELIRLKFSEGLSYQQMSTRMGLTVGNVGYLLHHALKAVAAELCRKGGT